MEIAIVSVANTNIEKREQVNFTDFQKIEFQKILQQHHINQCIILSTCNRSEVYAFASRDDLQNLRKIYQTFFAIEVQDMLFLSGSAAIQHILQVACGLKSTILGEDQIFKQVKDAYQFACIHQTIHKQVHFLFQNLFHMVKQIKHMYRLSEHPRSTSYVAMKLLRQHMNLEDASYLLCGGGQVITQCLPYIAQAKRIYIAVRDVDKQEQLQKLVPHVQVVPFAKRYEYFAKVDVLITATSSPHTIFKNREGMKGNKEQWILDLALPRDVQEELYHNSRYHIWNIDDVQRVVQYHEHIQQSTLQEIMNHIHEKSRMLYDASMQNTMKMQIYKNEKVSNCRKEESYEV